MLSTIIYQNVVSINYIMSSKLLFNSYTSYDNLTISILIIGGLIAVWLISLYGETVSYSKLDNEFLALIFLLIIAMGSLSSINSYLTLFVAIELQSLVLYILLAVNIKNIKTNVAPNLLSKVSLSYLINAATATALLIFGFSTNNNLLVLISIIWKLGVMPVHAWSLPILDNQHNIIVSIYLTITKYGSLLAVGLIASQSNILIQMLTIIGLINLTIGNILGLLQVRYQRIIVFSSLIQIGYMLLVLGNLSSLGLGYFELYSFFTIILLILWIVPTYYANSLVPSIQLWTLVLTLYTVAGLPFFPLFWTKLDILLAIQSESLAIALFSTLLSSFIYIRLIKYMSFFSLN
jgi:NADH-quinone oxidoreductase subunit N